EQDPWRRARAVPLVGDPRRPEDVRRPRLCAAAPRPGGARGEGAPRARARRPPRPRRRVMAPRTSGAPPRSLRFAAGETPRLNVDRVFGAIGASAAATVALVLVAIALAVLELSGPSLRAFGASFVTGRVWSPMHETYGALPFLYGT